MAYLANSFQASNENSLPKKTSILLHCNIPHVPATTYIVRCSNTFPRRVRSSPSLVREDRLTRRPGGNPLVKRQLGIWRIIRRKTFCSNRPLPAAEL